MPIHHRKVAACPPNVFVVSLMLACLSNNADANLFDIPSADTFPACNEKFYNTFGCVRAIEQTELQRTNSKAKRRPDGLRIRLDKTTIDLNDVKDESGDGTKFYSYIGYLEKLKVHVVSVQYSEGGGFMVIHHLSSQSEFPSGYPVASPSNSRFVNVSLDMFAGYSPNNVEVWRIESGSFRKEFSQDVDWGPSKARWVSETHVQIDKSCFVEPASLTPCGVADLLLINGKWSLK